MITLNNVKGVEQSMNIIHHILKIYSQYRDIILCFSFILSIIGIIFIFYKSQKRKYLFYQGLQKSFHLTVIIILGFLLESIEIKSYFQSVNSHINMVAAFFLIIICLMTLFMIIQFLIYQFNISIVLQMASYLLYIFYIELFLLIITSHLDLDYEFLPAITMILFLNCCNIFADDYIEKEDRKANKESDYPNPDLLYKRQIQLEKFISILDFQKDEPYAIMINGSWGSGKTSFVQALEKRLDQDIFIWIEAGSEKSVTEFMHEISIKIIHILKENNIYIESDQLIKKYFLTFSNILNESKFNFLTPLINHFTSEKNIDNKDYLDSKLKQLNKKIYLIIDDLDRCTDDYQDQMFKVIRESTNLNYCKTIFLVDKNQFNKKDNIFIEKYINYTLDLCDVDYKEIIDYFLDDVMTDVFIENMHNIIKKDKTKNDIKRIIIELPNNIIYQLEKEIISINNEFQNKIEESTKKELEYKKNEINKILNTIKLNIKNVRKVKRFLKSIKHMISKNNLGIEDIDTPLKKENWFHYIIHLQFIKAFLPDIYYKIKTYDDIEDVMENNTNLPINDILELDKLHFGETQIIVLNNLLYKEDIMNYSEIQTEKNKFLKELHSEQANITHINEYLTYFETYADLEKIIKICKKHNNENLRNREEFIQNLFKIISRQRFIHILDLDQLLNLSKYIIDWLKNVNLSTRETNIINNYSNVISRRILVDNTPFLRNVLFILFDDTKKVQDIWNALDVTNIEQFYKVLSQIDNQFEKEYINNDKDKLNYIKLYYEKCLDKLKDDRYKTLNLDLTKYGKKLDNIFETCFLWLNIEKDLKNKFNTEELENQYFDFDNFTYKNNVFISITNLEEALKNLCDIFNSIKDNYQSDYSLLLMRIALKTVIKYEENPDWFEGREDIINHLLEKIYTIAYNNDPLDDRMSKDVLEQSKIFIYKFNAETNTSCVTNKQT